jgi:hypothetical protein
VRGGGREGAVEAQPDEALDELMDGEERGQRGEEQLAAMLHLGEGDDADGAEDGGACEVGGGGEAHEGYGLTRFSKRPPPNERKEG